MYESFFDFHQRPFSAAPVADRYFPSGAMETARQTLIRIVDRAEGPGLVIGPAGSGKTLLCRLLAEHFRAQFQVACIDCSRCSTRKALLQTILFELGLPYREMDEGELRLALIDHLEPGEHCPHGLLLLIDEAHGLPLRLLDEIRMITNLVRDGRPRVRLVLAGSPSLEERFAHPKLESFQQRIAARCYLQALSREETTDYIRQQFTWVGKSADQILEADAMLAVFRATDGIPRLINQVCDHALLLAALGGRRTLDADAIEEAWADLQQLPMAPPAVKSSDSVIEFGSLDDSADDFDRADSSHSHRPSGLGGFQESQSREAPTSGQDFSRQEPSREPPFLQVARDSEEAINELEHHVAALNRGESHLGSSMRPQGSRREISAADQGPPAKGTTEKGTPVKGPASLPRVRPLAMPAPRPEESWDDSRGASCAGADLFGRTFAEEEVVIDHYASLDSNLNEKWPKVSSLEGRELAAALKASKTPEPAAIQATAAETAGPKIAAAGPTGPSSGDRGIVAEEENLATRTGPSRRPILSIAEETRETSPRERSEKPLLVIEPTIFHGDESESRRTFEIRLRSDGASTSVSEEETEPAAESANSSPAKAATSSEPAVEPQDASDEIRLAAVDPVWPPESLAIGVAMKSRRGERTETRPESVSEPPRPAKAPANAKLPAATPAVATPAAASKIAGVTKTATHVEASPAAKTSAVKSPTEVPAAVGSEQEIPPRNDDRDLIVVERGEETPTDPPPKARRQEYRRLFANLRKS